MKENKKETKSMKATKSDEKQTNGSPVISNKIELKEFLTGLRDKLGTHAVAPIYALTAMQYVFNLPGIYDLFDKANKELAQEIWLTLKQAGMQLKNPPMLFGKEE